MLGFKKGVRIDTIVSRINEEELLEAALNEVEQNRADPGLWTEALAESEGHLDASKAMYIKLSVQAKKDEHFLAEVLNLKSVSQKELIQVEVRANIRDRYRALAEELSIEFYIKGIWAKALVAVDGDEERAAYAYMKLRVQNMADVAFLKNIKSNKENQKPSEQPSSEKEILPNLASVMWVLFGTFLLWAVFTFFTIILPL